MVSEIISFALLINLPHNLYKKGNVLLSVTYTASTVTVFPVVTSVYPEVGRVNYTINESEPVTFECTATGIPAPDIEFNFSTTVSRVQIGVPSSPNKVARMSDGEMVYQVTRTSVINSTVDYDSGVYAYECIATNNIPGKDSQQFELIIQGMRIMITFTQLHNKTNY